MHKTLMMLALLAVLPACSQNPSSRNFALESLDRDILMLGGGGGGGGGGAGGM